MMNDIAARFARPPSRFRAAVIPLASALLACCGGCLQPQSTVDFVSYKDVHFPEHYSLKIHECVARVDSTGDYRIIGRVARTSVKSDKSPASPSFTSAQEYLDIHMFWRPKPGKTVSDSSAIDALLRFVVSAPRGVAVYSGTGFVYVRKDFWTGKTIAQLETGRLRPETISGSPPEIIGDCSLSGRLAAKEDGNRTVDLLRELDLLTAAKP